MQSQSIWLRRSALGLQSIMNNGWLRNKNNETVALVHCKKIILLTTHISAPLMHWILLCVVIEVYFSAEFCTRRLFIVSICRYLLVRDTSLCRFRWQLLSIHMYPSWFGATSICNNFITVTRSQLSPVYVRLLTEKHLVADKIPVYYIFHEHHLDSTVPKHSRPWQNWAHFWTIRICPLKNIFVCQSSTYSRWSTKKMLFSRGKNLIGQKCAQFGYG